MTQRGNDYPIDENAVSGTDLARILERTEAARDSADSGSSRPSYITAGGIWSKDLGGGAYELMMYDGSADTPVGSAGGAVKVFSQSDTYVTQDLVSYSGDIWMATVGHTGVWDPDHFIRQTMSFGSNEGEVYRWNATTQRWEAATEFRITSTGNVGIRQPSPTVALHVGEATDTTNILQIEGTYPYIQLKCASNGEASFRASDTTTACGWIWSASNDRWTCRTKAFSNAIQVNSNGNVNIAGYSGSVYPLVVNGQIASVGSSSIINISDAIHKTDVSQIPFTAIEVVKALKPVTFNYIPDTDIVGKKLNEEGELEDAVLRHALNFPPERQVGFIAQDIEVAFAPYPDILETLIYLEHVPEIIDDAGIKRADAYNRRRLGESKLLPIALKALQEAINKIEMLEARVTELEA